MENPIVDVALGLIEIAALLFPVVLISLQLGTEWWGEEELARATRLGMGVMITLFAIIGSALLSIVNSISIPFWLWISFVGVLSLGIVFFALVVQIYRSIDRTPSGGMD